MSSDQYELSQPTSFASEQNSEARNVDSPRNPLLEQSPTKPRSNSVSDFFNIKKAKETTPSLKRKKVEDSPEAVGDPATRINQAAKLIKEAVEAKIFNKAAKDTVLKGVHQLREIAAALRESDHQSTLIAAIEKIGADLQDVKNKMDQYAIPQTPRIQSYAAAASLIKATSTGNDTNKKTLPAIIIEPSEPGKKGEETLSDIRAKIPFRNLKIAPVKISVLSKGKIKMDFPNAEQRDAVLQKCENLASIKASAAKHMNPKMYLKGIPLSTGKEELTTVIKEQNDLQQDIRLCYLKRNKRNNNLYNAVVEVPPETRLNFLAKGRINVDHLKVHVEDFSPLTQCFKCLGFGHSASKCTEQENSCSHCGKSGHKANECPDRKDDRTAQCKNCHKYNSAGYNTHKRQTDHDARDQRNCSSIKLATEKAHEKINYGF